MKQFSETNPRGAGRKSHGTENKTFRLKPETIALLKNRAIETKRSQNELADEILSAGLKIIQNS